MAYDSNAPNAIQKTIIVRCDLEKAFRTWTEQIDAWWPKGHSRSGDPRTTVLLERGLGGRLYERTAEGVEHDWGQVIAWDAPRHVALHWYLGSSADQPTRVEVHFRAQPNGDTRIDLLHHGPELIGDLWGSTSAVFDTAWTHVLAAYSAACDPDRGMLPVP
jgi:uncharacterized protein YndB with AHSA1/START domain